MREIELKLQVPPAARAAVRRAVGTASARTERLQARYFDTPDRRLAAAGMALRLRREGRQWVQTLKTRGDGVMQRGEHEVRLPATRERPQLDLGRHAGTPAGEALQQALEGAAAPLAEIFATDIRRTRRAARAGGATIEIALDEGVITAGTRRAAVCEVEFELLRGPMAAVPVLASTWVERHGLWLDARSKAEIGDRLARDAAAEPTRSRPPLLHAAMRADEAFRAMLAAALDQVLRNACEVAAGAGDAEHLHQCRVGMRRLRCLLRDFGALAAAPMQLQAPGWRERLGELFQRLGSARDRDALGESLLPQLAAAGAPWAELPAIGGEEDPGSVLRSAVASRLWLEMLAALHAPPASGDLAPPAPLPDRVRPVLRGLHRKVAADAARFVELDEAGQHRTRKRLKRLRYGADFCASLYPDKAVAAYLAVLRPAQDALGAANDLVVARALFQPQVAADPRAWFVLGWLAGRRPSVLAECGHALAAIAKARPFWRRDPGG